ncbi:MAG: thiamine phosphate synthase [Bacteroidales bacterium]|jgi:thiamine-phosphate pyrophosphorylase|nr:thiamine phosphate synthase [Bacteroidales bacterium]
MTQEQQKAFQLQFITHHSDRYTYYQSAEMALRGGCKWVQLRMKGYAEQEVEQLALQLQPLCQTYNAVFIIDDHVEICKTTGADGVHLGKSDMHPCQAREILGENFIIGYTCNTAEDILHSSRLPVDYIGLGPFRFTSTKNNLSPVLGIEGYRAIMQTCRNNAVHIPVTAIGGITSDAVSELLQTGVQGVAISGAILQADNPTKETKEIMRKIHLHTKQKQNG